MKITTDKTSYKIPAEGPTGKTSIVGVHFKLVYEGTAKNPKDWVAIVIAGKKVASQDDLKDSAGKFSEWKYTDGKDIDVAMSVNCLDKAQKNYGGTYEVRCWANDDYAVELARSAPFTIAV